MIEKKTNKDLRRIYHSNRMKICVEQINPTRARKGTSIIWAKANLFRQSCNGNN